MNAKSRSPISNASATFCGGLIWHREGLEAESGFFDEVRLQFGVNISVRFDVEHAPFLSSNPASIEAGHEDFNIVSDVIVIDEEFSSNE